MKSLILSII